MASDTPQTQEQDNFKQQLDRVATESRTGTQHKPTNPVVEKSEISYS